MELFRLFQEIATKSPLVTVASIFGVESGHSLSMNYSSLSCDELVHACAESGDFEAWEEFVRRFGKVVSVVIWRIARMHGERNDGIVKDLVQDTFTKVCEDNCRFLREFNPRHTDAFFGMLKVTAANVARDHFRACNSEKRGFGKAASDLDESEAVAATHRSGPDEMERQILLQEIDKALQSVCPQERDREIFWLHYRQGFTATAIARIGNYGLTAKGIESLLHRLRSQLRTRLVDQGPFEKISSQLEGVGGVETLSKEEGRP